MTQQPPPQPPYKGIGLEDVRKVLDSKLVNTGVPGAIAGFGISRAFEGEWWQFGSLLGAAAGVWFLIKLGNRFAPKVERVIERADQAFNRQVDLALVNRSKFHQQYLEALKTHCRNLKVEGYKGRLPRLVLEEVYVPLRMNAGTRQTSLEQYRSRPIWDFLPKAQDRAFPERLLAVIADPGYGKTTLMRFLTLSFSNQGYGAQGAKELIPILLLFREFYSRIQSQTQPPLSQLIVEEVQNLPRCSELRTSEPWFKDQLQQGKCLVMLDGLDEVPEAQRDTVSRWANWQMQNYPSQFILTSRPHGYDSSLFEGVQRVDILDFNNDQKRTFIHQWYRFITWELIWKAHWSESQHEPDPQKRLSRQQAEAESNAEAQQGADDLSRQVFGDKSLTDLAKNPLLITIIAATHEASEQLPKRRVHLYQEIFKLLLEYRPNRRDTRLTIPSAETNQLILQKLALELTLAGKTQFSPQQGAEWIQVRLAEEYPDKSLTPQKFLQEIQQVSGLLVGGEGHLYEFTHKTFQEYLTAVELDSYWGREQIAEHFVDKNWEEIIVFYATAFYASDPTWLIEKALNDPDNAYTLQLAQRLANEAITVDEGYKQELLNLRQRQAPESTEVVLAKRFWQVTPLSDHTVISEPITWGEYQRFIEAQQEGAFHSWANAEHLAVVEFSAHELLDDVTWEDARWFCAWLATQAQLAPDEGVYDYRLPTPEEAETLKALAAEESPLAPLIKGGGDSRGDLTPWTTDPQRPGNCLRVVRQRIPDRYRELVNYLASGSWKEADQATDKLMLQAVGEKAGRWGSIAYLRLDEIRNFPCEDLLLIDQLWVKFSGSKFGFSVQKQIWVEVGGRLDFGKNANAAIAAFAKMSNRNGWRVKEQYIPYSQVTFSTSAPSGHLPVFVASGGTGREWEGKGERTSRFFSRIQTCKL